jgi:hypothetical protein
MIGSKRKISRLGLLIICLLVVALLAISMEASAPVHGQEEPQGIETGPIDPAAGAWIIYRGERTVPGQTGPQAFSLRIEYGFPKEASQLGRIIEATVTELNAAGQAVSARTFHVQTIDRFYRSQDGAEEGFWVYWLTPGLDVEDAASVGTGTRLTADEAQDFDFKGNAFRVVRMRGDGIELLAEQHTGLVFRIMRDGGENLNIEDTNMLGQYSAWKYTPDAEEVGNRLEALAGEYPDMVEVSSPGNSAMGRDIWLAHITDFTSSDAKRNVIISAAMEGNAPEGCAFLLNFLEELVKIAEEDPGSALLNKLNIFVVPMVNPDGIQRWLAMPAPEGSPELGSQAPRNGNLVRIDRNFDVKWEEGDHNPASGDYAGPAPFSETESQTLNKLFQDIPADLYLNLHAGSDIINAPWNWSESPASNPERTFYESILLELSTSSPFPAEVGAPLAPFTGSSTDWAYEGNGASSPICFDLYLHRPRGDAAGSDALFLEYAPQREAVFQLIENLQYYLAVDIIAPNLGVEVNVPVDAVAEIKVSGKRALPNARARLILPEDSGLKFTSMAEKEVELGNLEPGSSVEVKWGLEGRTSGSNMATIVLISSYPEYENIPGTYSAEMEISISAQRTWLVVILLSLLVLLVLGMIFFSMRKHSKASDNQP